MNKEETVIRLMLEENVIPKTGMFSITTDMIDFYFHKYDELFSKSVGVKRNNNERYAKKLAALSLIKLNKQREEIVLDYKRKKTVRNNCGFVYVISNPAFSNAFKVGITKDLNKRLSTYQTYDPNRNFKVEHYVFCENAREKEKSVLKNFSLDLIKGEWINKENSSPILKELLS